MRHHILLVNAPLTERPHTPNLCPPLGNLVLGSHLLAQGWPVRLLDPTAELPGLSPLAIIDHIVATLKEARPRVLGITTHAPAEARFAVALARRAKEALADTTILLGGMWATPCWREALTLFPFVDAVAVGEGEMPCQALLESHPLADIPGLASRDPKGAVVPPSPAPVPPASPLRTDLLARPDRYDTMVYLTSRGCPFACTFCSETLVTKHYRAEPLDKVRADLEAIAALGAQYLWICDPLFGLDPGRSRQVLEILERTGLPSLVESRVDVLDPSLAPDLAAGGCDIVYLGMESGTYSSLEVLGKVQGQSQYRAYVERAEELVASCVREGVLPVLGILNPLPGDGPLELDQTLDVLKRLRRAADGAAGGRQDRGVFFYAFPCRLDRGTGLHGRLDTLRSQGATFMGEEGDIFQDILLDTPGPTVTREAVAAFRQAVLALSSPWPDVLRRVGRTRPAAFIDFGGIEGG